MLGADEMQKAIMDSLQVDNTGLKNIKTIDITELQKLGVDDVALFLNGLLDSENEKDFNDSSPDYVKGYKYGKTGKF